MLNLAPCWLHFLRCFPSNSLDAGSEITCSPAWKKSLKMPQELSGAEDTTGNSGDLQAFSICLAPIISLSCSTECLSNCRVSFCSSEATRSLLFDVFITSTRTFWIRCRGSQASAGGGAYQVHGGLQEMRELRRLFPQHPQGRLKQAFPGNFSLDTAFVQPRSRNLKLASEPDTIMCTCRGVVRCAPFRIRTWFIPHRIFIMGGV